MWPQVFPAALRPFGGIGQRVELVVTHDDAGGTCIDHRLDDLQHAELLVSPVD